MSRLIAMGVGLILIGVVCFAHANQMDDVVQALILEASEESLEDVESTLLKLGSVAVDSLIRLLASDDSALRMTAVRVLGSMDHSIDEKLFQVLRDDRWRVRVAVVSALAHHQSDRVVIQLLAKLQDAHPAVRAAAARALGRLGNVAAVDSLILVLQDEKRIVRKSAAKALGKIKDSRAIGPLIEILQEGGVVQWESMRALAHIGQPAVQPLSAIVADGTRSNFFRQIAAKALREIALLENEPSVVTSVHALGVGLRDSDAGVRQASADALVIIGKPAADVLRTALLNDPDPEVRAEAATIFGRSGSARAWYAEAVDMLILALVDQEESVRAAAQAALIRIHVIAHGQLVVALKDKNPIRRMGVSTVLGAIGHRGSIQPLETLLKVESDPAVRTSIESALALLRTKPSAKMPSRPSPATLKGSRTSGF